MNTEARNPATIGEELATFVADLRFDQIPPAGLASVKQLVLDQFACQLMGSTLPWVKPARNLVQRSKGGVEECTIVNYGDRVSILDGAFLNATFGQACEMDDYAAGSSGHMGTATIPVALAVAESVQANGREFLTAVVAGYEVMYRLMRAVTPHAEIRGFHSQTIAGPFAAAAVTGKLMGFDKSRMIESLAIAGSFAGGTTEYDQSGGEVKRIHAGIAARGGVQAALLASYGLTGPHTIVEGKRGFCNTFTDRGDPGQIAEGLGKIFHLDKISYKLFPAVGAVHTSIVAMNRLVAEHDFKPAEIVRIRVGLSEHALKHSTTIRVPQQVVGAQYSLAYSLALAATRKGHDLSNYMDGSLWRDQQMILLMNTVEAYAYPGASGRFSHVEVELSNGQKIITEEHHIKGSPLNPATQKELDGKFQRLTSDILSDSQASTLISAVSCLEDLESAADLASLIVRGK